MTRMCINEPVEFYFKLPAACPEATDGIAGSGHSIYPLSFPRVQAGTWCRTHSTDKITTLDSRLR